MEIVKRDIAAPEDESKSLAEDPNGEASSLAQLTRREAFDRPPIDPDGEGYPAGRPISPPAGPPAGGSPGGSPGSHWQPWETRDDRHSPTIDVVGGSPGGSPGRPVFLPISPPAGRPGRPSPGGSPTIDVMDGSPGHPVFLSISPPAGRPSPGGSWGGLPGGSPGGSWGFLVNGPLARPRGHSPSRQVFRDLTHLRNIPRPYGLPAPPADYPGSWGENFNPGHSQSRSQRRSQSRSPGRPQLAAAAAAAAAAWQRAPRRRQLPRVAIDAIYHQPSLGQPILDPLQDSSTDRDVARQAK